MKIHLHKRVAAVTLLALAALAVGLSPVLAGRDEAGSAAQDNLLVVEVQGGPQSGQGYAGVTQDTRADSGFWVSNSPTAYNRVRVSVRAPSGEDDIQAEIANLNGSGGPLALPLSQDEPDGPDHHWYVGVAHVVASPPGATEIQAENGDQLRVSYAGSQVTLVVDGTLPTISNVSPTQDLHASQPFLTFSGTIRDHASGMRTNAACGEGAEGPGCSDWSGPDANQNGLTNGEPRTFIEGGAADIRMRLGIGGASTEFTQLVGDLTRQISQEQDWNAVTGGFSFSLPWNLIMPSPVVDHRWVFQARDRAGNQTTVHRRIVVDTERPEMISAHWGLGFDAATQTEIEDDPRWIKVRFANAGGSPVRLNAQSVLTSSFTISGQEIQQVLYHEGDEPNGSEDAVYIRLAEAPDLASVLTVFLTGAMVRDLAGNQAFADNRVAQTVMLPRLTVTMTGEEESGRAVASAPAGGEITIRIVSDRQLAGVPSIYVQRFLDDGRPQAVVRGVKLREAWSIPISAVSGEANTWEVEVNAVDVGGPGLFGLWIEAADAAANPVTSGSGGIVADAWTGNTRVIDLTQAHLGEFDSVLGEASAWVAPGGEDATSSRDPYVYIDFAEGDEYGIPRVGSDYEPTDDVITAFDCGAPSAGASVRCVAAPGSPSDVGTDPVRVEADTHLRADLTNVTFGGADITAQATRTGDAFFYVPLSDLELGDYSISFNGRDTAGNSFADDQTFAFSVLEHAPYQLDLEQGWNMVSFPGSPEDPAIGAVFGAPVTAVVTFNGGSLSHAVRWPDGAWEGQLTTIRGGMGYWVYASGPATITTRINGGQPAPVVDLDQGWNLVPVMDRNQAPAGGPPGGGPPVTIARYLSGVDWATAYSYSASSASWTTWSPTEGGRVRNGEAYWVWTAQPASLPH